MSNQQPNFYVSDPSAPQTTNVHTSQPRVPQISSVTNPVFAAVQSQPNFQPSVPQHSMQNDSISPNALLHNAMSDITRFMYRKDFLLSRFVNFDDKPSFQSVTRELGVTTFEEMDLLVKWLGHESSKFAKSIHAANAHDPPRGLQRIYDRLQERYGKPDMVESAMKRKLNSFPTLTSKENVKLYDLLDILTEIESAMLHPQYATLFSYYNSSSGVIPIISMLSHFLQEKWTTLASSYKKTHQVSFPPFSFFIRFIRDICEICNHPAFSHSNYNQSTASETRPSVISRRLDITSNNSNRCPLCKAGHTLNDCRGFGKRSLQDRQKFLRENRICFKCCKSHEHIAQNCTANIKC